MNTLEDIISLNEIFKDSIPNPEQIISVEYIPCNNNNSSSPVCVFGILESKHGLKIKEEMLQWLSTNYNVYCVSQKSPGKFFEYPALCFAQYLCQRREVPYLLYLHTKGAARSSIIQSRIRSMWKNQFTWNIQIYLRSLTEENYDVVCPLLGPNNETWYNGLYITSSAFGKIPDITLSKDRYVYQRLFSKSLEVKIKGILKQNINAIQLDAYMMSHTFTGKEVKFSPDFSMGIEYGI